MSPDEWRVEGLDHMDASKSDAHGVSTKEAMVSRLTRIEQATVCFSRANDTFLENKSRMHQDLLSRCLDAAKSLDPEAMAVFSGTLVRGLKGGLIDEVAQVLEGFILMWRHHDVGSSNGDSAEALTILERISKQVRDLKTVND